MSRVECVNGPVWLIEGPTGYYQLSGGTEKRSTWSSQEFSIDDLAAIAGMMPQDLVAAREPTKWPPFEVEGEPAEGFPIGPDRDPCWQCKGYGVGLIEVHSYKSKVPVFILDSSHCPRCFGVGIEPR